MAKPRLSDVLSHWHKPFIDFQTSAIDFYTAVEEGLKKREVPDIAISRVTFREAGFGSARRVYLRIKRRGLAFDVGAAPFGAGFFFSWWLTRVRPSRLLGLLLLIVLLPSVRWLARWVFALIYAIPGTFEFLLAHQGWRVPILRMSLYFLVVYILVFLLVRQLALRLPFDFDGLLSAVPILGPVYRRLFVSETYHTVDTALAYQAVVKSVVEDAIDGVTSAKGLRALTEDEKKPRMENFYGR